MRYLRRRPSNPRLCPLRVVLIDSDRRLGELLHSVLGGDGHVLVPYASPQAAGVELGSADVAILDLSLAGQTSEVEDLGVAFSAAGADLILTSSTHGAQDPFLRSLMGNLGARAFFRKPFSMLDLSDRLREIERDRRRLGALRSLPPVVSPAPKGDRAAQTRSPAAGASRPPAYLAVTSPDVTIEDPDDSESVVPARATRSAGRRGARSARTPRGLAAGQQDADARARPPTKSGQLLPLAAEVARLWVARATGALRIADGTGPGETKVILVRGGPLNFADHRRIVDAMLGGSRIAFDSASLAGSGDWQGLGGALFAAVRGVQAPDFLELNLRRAVRRTASTDAASALPLSSAAQRIIGAATGTTSLQKVIAALSVDPTALGQDLGALVALGLIDLVAATDGDLDADDQTSIVGPRVSWSQVRRTMESKAGSSVSGASIGDGVTFGDPDNELPDPHSLRGRDRVGGALRTVRPVGDDAILRRLQRERDALQTSEPHFVLGLAPDAPAEMVAAAAERMSERYRAIATDKTMSNAVRAVAIEIGEKVDAARHVMEQRASRNSAREGEAAWEAELGATTSVAPPSVPPEERLLLQARDALRGGRPAVAARLLEQARDLRLDHPAVLANLGWSRFKALTNPSPEALDDVRDLLLLAVQFDARNFEARLYLAQVLDSSGDSNGARVHASAAHMIDPNHPLAQELHARLTAEAPPKQR
jgi:DNA-binding response OmpR family regulator